MLTKEMGNIDWNNSAVQIERLVRGVEFLAQRIYTLERESDENLEGKGGKHAA